MTEQIKAIVLVAGLALACQVSAQEAAVVSAPSVQAAQNTVPAGSVTGMAALRMIEDRLEAFAAEYHLTPAEMASSLRNDRSMYITPEGRLLALCPLAPDQGEGDDGDSVHRVAAMGIPLDSFLDLESNPGASKTIYLDFTGHLSQNNSWGHNINFPAYNTSGTSATFDDTEKADIIAHWAEVVEDFAPYNVNVTTRDPGLAALTKSGGADTTYGIRCVMTQATSGFGDGIGGVAFLNSFDDSIDNPCFGFNKGLGAGPQTASHEVGHTLGLSHDGLNGQTYHPGSTGGSPTWGPIMGAPFGRQLVQWSSGDYPGSSTTQNDTGIITNSANGIGTYADDHTSNILGGTVFDIASQATGILNSRTDTDALTFTVPTGEINISVKNVDNGPNTDLEFELYQNNPLVIIEDFSPLGTADATKSWNLAAGTYTILIDGTFQTKTNGPVSDYGSFGGYTVDVSVILPPEPVVITFPGGIPTELDEGVPTQIVVNIDPGSFTLDPNDLWMYYGQNVPFPFLSLPLVSQGGNNYAASLPAGACDDTFAFNFEVGLLDAPDLFSPADPLQVYNAAVVCSADCVADTNGDGILSPADFSAWVAAFNAQSAACDQNGDGLCTPADFSAWVANFNAGCP